MKFGSDCSIADDELSCGRAMPSAGSLQLLASATNAGTCKGGRVYGRIAGNGSPLKGGVSVAEASNVSPRVLQGVYEQMSDDIMQTFSRYMLASWGTFCIVYTTQNVFLTWSLDVYMFQQTISTNLVDKLIGHMVLH